ncbi:MAG: hypothetical protein HQK78_15385, partial [Desulfobacterales bacterium]|nr:hypothetical protein [Desulfobacterales bacterium]
MGNSYLSYAGSNSLVDIRVDGSLNDDPGKVSYVTRINDFSNITSISFIAGDKIGTISPNETYSIPNSPLVREFKFEGIGENKLNPQVTLQFSDGSNQVYTESFHIDKELPSLSFEAVNLSDIDKHQYLVVSAKAKDDVDISYVNFSVVGIRASDLRDAGGIVARARENAFAKTNGFETVYPVDDSQELFTLPLEITKILDKESIEHDGIVLIDIMAVDASGNQNSLSKIAFTGKDVVEKASNLQVIPSRIIFTNLLESVTIIPSVDFQFRGMTPLPGSGNGITYESSNPNLVLVTNEGVVYPLQETGSEKITVTVKYPDLTPINIPVEVDLSKGLVALKAKGLNENGQFVLSRLNSRFQLPKIIGIFNDGIESEITSQVVIEYILDENASGIIDLNPQTGLLSKALIPSSNPILMTVRLKGSTNILAKIPIIAFDSIPEIDIELPSEVKAGTQLLVHAKASDDVGISEVRFMMNETFVGSRQKPPYDLTIDITKDLARSALSFKVIAIDTAGQQNETSKKEVKVIPEEEFTIPKVDIDFPLSMQRFVEATPVKYQVSTNLKDTLESDINYVEIYLDGKRLGMVFPSYEKRQDKTGLFKIWRTEALLPSISTDETSSYFYALVNTNGKQFKTDQRLIRVIKNTSPSILITSPVSGTPVSVGQDLNINVEMTDDTLPLGLNLSLLMNGKVFKEYVYEKKTDYFSGNFNKKASYSFIVPIGSELLGTTITFQVEGKDFHGLISKSEEIKLSVKNDQPPNVAITNPVMGAHFVSGLPIEIRANANDDIGIKRIDFYVQDRLVGSSDKLPYFYQYQTPEGITTERSFKIFVKAIDTKDQETKSEDVLVTLGKDEEPPVVNIVSPVITKTEGGEELSIIAEESEVVFKVAGYDNVEIKNLEVRGIQKQSNTYVFTGNMDHVLSGDEFSPQQIPGTLHAFSALKLVRVPIFSRASGIAHDLYPIKVVAIDKSGNSSEANIVIAVVGDSKPSITDVNSDKKGYFPKDLIRLNICAKDDKGVTKIEAKYYLDEGKEPVFSDEKEIKIPANTIDTLFSLDLDKLNISNANHKIRTNIHAIDNKGQYSDTPYIFEIKVDPDVTAPLSSIYRPLPGSMLYHDESVLIKAKAIDNSKLSYIEIKADGNVIYQQSQLNSSEIEAEVNYKIPKVGEELLLILNVKDIFGNESSTNWRYFITDDVPPVVSVRSPPQGSRLIEGEQFTLIASVTDNLKVVSAVFFIEQDGKTLFSKEFNEKEIENGQAGGRYLSVGMHVPHKPDTGESTIRIGVRATDERSLKSEAILELEILDDLESPKIDMSEPSGNIRVMPGTVFNVKGNGEDNVYINDIIPVIIDDKGIETDLSWAVISRNDKMETITAPNPNSFGGVIVGQRFHTTFDGRIKLPLSYFKSVGQSFKFLLKAKDNGVNEGKTLPINITIQGDEKPPYISILEPKEKVYELQAVSARVQITDDISIASYKVYIDSSPLTILKEEKDLDKESIEITTSEIDLSKYDFKDKGKDHFALVVEARDASGNLSRETKIVYIKEDLPPILSISNQLPENDIVKGGIAFQTIKIEDDYAASNSPLSYFAVYTSLKGLDQEGVRDPMGEILDNIPYISIGYPEAKGIDSRLTVGDKAYIETKAGRLNVSPIPAQNSKLKLDFGQEYTVKYKVKVLEDSICNIPKGEYIVESLDNIIFSEINSAHIIPEISDKNGAHIDSYIQAIQLDKSNLSSQQISISVYIKDSHEGERLAVISSDMIFKSSALSNSSATKVFVPSHYDIQDLSILAHGIDRFSKKRGPQTLQVLSNRNAVSDAIQPTIIVKSPANGVNLVPLQQIDIKIEAHDNSNAIAALQMFEGQNKLIREIGGKFGVSDYQFAYQVPREYSNSELKLLVVAKDYSGASASQVLTFPVINNEPPQLNFKAFSSYEANGKYLKVYDTPERLNYGEFWLRHGEKFKLDVSLADDAGIDKYLIFWIDSSGIRHEIFKKELSTICPQPKVTNTDVAAEIIFDKLNPTEYESVVIDNYGNQTKRTFIIHPQTNLIPQVRIAYPAQDQLIAAGTFKIKIGLAAADDRIIPDDGIEFYANNTRLNILNKDKIDSASIKQA